MLRESWEADSHGRGSVVSYILAIREKFEKMTDRSGEPVASTKAAEGLV